MATTGPRVHAAKSCRAAAGLPDFFQAISSCRAPMPAPESSAVRAGADVYDESGMRKGDTMNLLGAIILGALILLAAFALANWRVLAAPVTLSFIAFDAEGPPGVILLGAMLVLVGLLAGYVMVLRTNMLMESRRHNQELEAQRKLAESAVASRLGDLRTQVGIELAQLQVAVAEMDAHPGRPSRTVRQSLDASVNGLAALVDDMDGRIDRILARGIPETKEP
jgi:uncharacterized integral membrane protein